MNVKELKLEIQKSLEEVPENVLEEILAYLKEVKKSPDRTLLLSNWLKNIMAEDKDLLEKLAK